MSFSSPSPRPHVFPARALVGALLLCTVAATSPLLAQTPEAPQEGATPAAPVEAAPAAPVETAPTAQVEAAPAPRLVVDAPIWDSPEIVRDAIAEHTFELRNEGKAPLEIARIVTSGNVEIAEKPQRIEPGGRFPLKVSVSLLRESPAGIRKQLEIHSNDPDRPVLPLEMRIRSVERIRPNPERARWISVQQEMDGKISSIVTSVDGTPFRILGISAPPEGITVKFRHAPTQPGATNAPGADPAAPNTTWQVDMVLAKNAPVGAIVGRLDIQTDHPQQKIVPIPLSGFMRPVLAVTPYEVKLGEVPAATTKLHDFFVRNFATDSIGVTKVEHDLPGFGAATIEAIDLGRRYSVKVPMDLKDVPKGPIHGTIRIYTDSAKIPFYSVPVDGVVK